MHININWTYWFDRHMPTYVLDDFIKNHKAECYDNMILKLNNTITWGHC